MRFIKYLGITLVLVIAAAVTAFYGILNGWNIDKLDHASLSKQLAPHYEVFLPKGSGPFPTIVGFHGCSGMLEGIRDWAKALNQAGYAAVLTDSMKPRELAWRDVCAGKVLWGNERAGDAAVAIQDVKQMSFVDQNNLILMGWSHGGWATLDLLAYSSKGKTPPNLKTLPADTLQGVKAAIAIYPFCEFPAFLRHGWNHDFPVHFIFAQNDSIVKNQPCEELIQRQKESGQVTTSITYADVDHAFDMRKSDFYEDLLSDEPETTAIAHRDLIGFLESL